MKKILLLSAVMAFADIALADEIEVTDFTYEGPYEQKTPFVIDSTDVAGNRIVEGKNLYIARFSLDVRAYTDATFKVKGVSKPELFVDDVKATGKTPLIPNAYNVEVRYRADAKCDSLKVTVSVRDGKSVTATTQALLHRYNIYDVLHAKTFRNVSLSADGRFMLSETGWVNKGGKATGEVKLTDLKKGTSSLLPQSLNARWMPKSTKYYYLLQGNKGRELVVVNPTDGSQEVLADNLPADASIQFAPTEEWLLLTTRQDGPKENPQVFEVIEPDDRQPGWRNRTNLARYDLKTHQIQTLTYGYHNVYCQDISADGKYILIQKSESRLTGRPTTVFSLYRLDVATLEADLLVDKDGFIEGAKFSPDGTKVLISGNPECLGGIGRNVREDQIPSMTDIQLYLMDIGSRNVTPLTKYFNPNVTGYTWNKYDGKVYFTAEDRDSVNMFVMNPNDGKIKELSLSEELISSFDLCDHSPVMAFYGNSASSSDRLYTMNTKSGSVTLAEDLSATTLKDVEIATCKPWTFTNSRGETIYGRYYVPSDFDASKQYPMIVNYYGGCSPTSRHFESRYPHHAYAELGYIVLIINPSGATGFGQEFSARHVNTAGKGVADDIIEGTKQFCKEHTFVNADKIGCIGASYGGFMTQYLLTQTDIFAAGISHAGISDHTSYWGEGYWGYSYSEVSMAGSYPWTRKDLYVDQSPLFNADKIHTPLLFVHGTSDTNVPVGESIQMYTALKLLGRPTAMVLVEGENHWILDYTKRIRWQNTIFAWFAKWLQDDDGWWQSMYSDKKL